MKSNNTVNNSQVMLYSHIKYITFGLCSMLILMALSTSQLYAQKAVFKDLNGSILNNGQTVDPQDSLALVALYHAMDGDNWFNNAGWLVDGVEFWHGVTHVNEVNPDEWRVTRINLGENYLRGELPPEIGELVYLERLALNDNYIYGPLPTEVADMTAIQRLDFRRTIMTGVPPWEELVSLPNLEYLWLNGNRFEGQLPSILGNFPRMFEFDIQGNNFTGPIPAELGNVTTLNRLHIGDTWFTGDIPSELGNLENLRRLTVRNVPFINPGPFPAWLRDMAETIERIEMQGAQLTGEIPEWINELYRLQRLHLGGGDEIGGPIPDMTFLTNLDWLDLSEGNFSGPIPEWIGNMPAIQRLTLTSNPITGQIPSSIANSSLERLDFRHLQLEGPLPDLRNLNLDRLEFEDIGFSIGPIPEWIGTQGRLDRIELTNVGLTGEIPSFLNSLDALVRLEVADNPELTGTIPEWLVNKQDLAFLNLSRTGVSVGDEIPSWLANRPRLERIGLGGLGLNGTIPDWLGDLTLLEELALDGNNLTGEIPSSLGNLLALDSLNVGNNQLSGSIPVELANAGRIGPITLMNSIIVSGNENLTGEIPAVFTDWDPDVFRVFWFDNTGLCIPEGSGLNSWLDEVAYQQNPRAYASVRVSDAACTDTSLEDDPGSPYRFALNQSYPNPFNPSTNITFEIPDNGHVSLRVYNVLGMHVSTLVNENRTAGKYDVQFDAGNLASGTYFYRLQAGGKTQVKRMMLVK